PIFLAGVAGISEESDMGGEYK
ncbi:MAG: hypothetical protein RIR10_826, partial [Planctomycetota bacterium]